TFGFSSNKKATYQYKLDNGTEWISVTDSTLDLKGLSDGQHTIYARSLDIYGNYSDQTLYQWTIASHIYASDIGINNLSGTLSVAGNLWEATQDNPASIKMEGTIVPRRGVLDIHAADQGWQGGSWTVLLPGGVTHTNSYSNDNRISSQHPIVQGLVNDDYNSWGATSHGYFTNLYPDTTVILNDSGDKDKPTTIEYLYQKDQNSKKVLVIASMQTLEWAYYYNYAKDGLPLKNTIAYLLYKSGITPNRGKLLLLQDNAPWSYDSNKLLLDSWGISYDKKTSTEFATLDLSPYPAIIISSDQSSTFYSNIEANISKFDNFFAPNFVDTWFTDIYSYNKSDSTYTFAGGAYMGFIGGAQVDNTLEGNIYAVAVNSSNAGGILKGTYSGSYDLTAATWATTGSMFPVYLESNMSVTPTGLHDNIEKSNFYQYAPTYPYLGSGSFDGGGYIHANFLYGMEKHIKGYDKWGVFASETGGTFSGITSNGWSGVADIVYSDKDYLGINIQGNKWASNKLSGSFTGYHADYGNTHVTAGDTFGTFNPTDYKWHAINMGVWLETNKFLELAATEEGRKKLQHLNVPSFQVGVVTLEQNSTGSALNNVKLIDVKFFSPSSGGVPSIWATGNVIGGFVGAPINQTASLSGGGLSANFTMKQLDTTNNK
ncbi:MAG TPA: hypothetical protein PLM23_10155, partial [Syntrophorhabdaceae bacterium]|nr:hypothetical protein [Syntrophorhabdaceae bacterium]